MPGAELTTEQLPVGIGVWLVRDPTVGVPAGIIAARLSEDGLVYDVVELLSGEPWVSEGHPTVAAAVTKLTAFLVEHGL